jgi:hypothetical protein
MAGMFRTSSENTGKLIQKTKKINKSSNKLVVCGYEQGIGRRNHYFTQIRCHNMLLGTKLGVLYKSGMEVSAVEEPQFVCDCRR